MKLKPTGVETLGVVNTTLDKARLYFKYRPARMPLAADQWHACPNRQR